MFRYSLLRRRYFFYLACALFAAAAFCLVEFKTGGPDGFKVAFIATLSLGAIFGAGSWAAGLPTREQASSHHHD